MPTLIASIEMAVAHSNVTVYNSELKRPYNDWKLRHVNQGFTWREGSVSFGTLRSIGMHTEVWIAEQIELLPQTQLAIQVPFVVQQHNKVGISDSCGDEILDIPSGSYNLLFENGICYDREYSEEEKRSGLEDIWCRLSFIPCQSPQAIILREVPDIGDIPLSPIYPLLMEAEPV